MKHKNNISSHWFFRWHLIQGDSIEIHCHNYPAFALHDLSKQVPTAWLQMTWDVGCNAYCETWDRAANEDVKLSKGCIFALILCMFVGRNRKTPNDVIHAHVDQTNLPKKCSVTCNRQHQQYALNKWRLPNSGCSLHVDSIAFEIDSTGYKVSPALISKYALSTLHRVK